MVIMVIGLESIRRPEDTEDILHCDTGGNGGCEMVLERRYAVAVGNTKELKAPLYFPSSPFGYTHSTSVEPTKHF